MVKSILLPTLEQSITSNTRWLRLFPRKHGLDLHDLPFLPVKPKFLTELLNKYGDILPASILDLHQRMVLTNISPPKK